MDYISIPPWVGQTALQGLTWVPYMVALYFMFQLGKLAYAFVMSLAVQGEPNEWVVTMRNGEQVKAGIGFSGFRSPFEQVAVFPSRLVKVEVVTQQVTKEMQGIQVSSMIEWTVDRDAPLKAFKNLDLASGNYNAANETLRAMTSAIVRNQVANSTIDHVIKNRQMLREEILKEMNEVVSGWGVHLATCEVCDVKILSSGLFKDMQSKFREENVKKATLEKMVVGNSLYFEKLQKDVETAKRNANTEKIRQEAQHTEELKQARQNIEQFRQQCAIALRDLDRVNGEKLYKRENEIKVLLKELEYSLTATKAECDKSIRLEQSKRLIKEQAMTQERETQQEKLKLEKLKATSAREIKQADYDLLKEGLADPVIAKLKYMELVGDLYNSISVGSFKVNHMGSDDPIAQILSKFMKMSAQDDQAAQAQKK